MSGRSAERAPARVTLLTDFGTRDGYVAAMKGVIVSRCPGALIDDLTHEIRPGDIRGGALALASAVDCFPAGTIHVAVVDPGVGTDRLPLLVLARGQALLGPDNGLLSLAVGNSFHAYRLDRPRYFRSPVSATFHGRDVFASVAGHLAAGVPPESVGSLLESPPVELPLPMATYGEATATGEVIHVDRFGNLVTNLRADRLPIADGCVEVELDGESLGSPVATYAAVAPGHPAVVVGSAGYLEVSVRDGSAAARFGARKSKGTRVRACWTEKAGCRGGDAG